MLDEPKVRRALAKAERDCREAERKVVSDLLVTLPSRIAPLMALGGGLTALLGGSAILQAMSDGDAVPSSVKVSLCCVAALIAFLLAVVLWNSLNTLAAMRPKRVDLHGRVSFQEFGVAEIRKIGGSEGDEQAVVDLLMARVALAQRDREAEELRAARDRLEVAVLCLTVAFALSSFMAVGVLILKSS